MGTPLEVLIMRKESLSPSLQMILDTRTQSIEQELFDFQRDQKKLKGPKLNADMLMNDLARGQNCGGENLEALQEAARRDRQLFSPIRPYISFVDLYAAACAAHDIYRRDLTKAVGSAGGFLVGTQLQDSLDVLRPERVLERAGMQIEYGLVGDQLLPKVSAKSTQQWLPNEASQGTESINSLVQIALTPKNTIGTFDYSRLFAKQTNAPVFASRELLNTAWTSITQGVLTGLGTSGQMTGIVNTAGVQTQSGTTLNIGVTVMQQKSAEANASDARITFLSTPAVRQLLRIREIVTGSGRFVWDRDQVADRPAYVSTDVPTATMICGDFSLVYLGFWGAGLFLEINPYEQTNFRAGIIQARVLVSCDCAVLAPSAFVVASSIT